MAKIEFSEDGTALLAGEARTRFQEFFDRHIGSSPKKIRTAWAKELGGQPTEAIVSAIHAGDANAGGL